MIAQRALVVVQIELKRKSAALIVFPADIPLQNRVIGQGPLPRVMHPASQVIVVRLLAHTTQVGCEGAAHGILAFAYRVTGQASSRLEKLPSPSRIPGSLWRDSFTDPRLPDESGDRFDLLIGQAELRHLGGGPEGLGILDPHRDPFPAQLVSNLFQIGSRPLAFHQEFIQTGIRRGGVSINVGYPQRFLGGLRVKRGCFFVACRVVPVIIQPFDLDLSGFFLGLQIDDSFAGFPHEGGLDIESLIGMTTLTAAVLEQILGSVKSLGTLELPVEPMALNAASFKVCWCVERPQPVLVPAVCSRRADRSHTVSIVAGRATEDLGITRGQQLPARVTDKKPVAAHVVGAEINRLSNAEMARFTAVHQIHSGVVNLPDLNCRGVQSSSQPVDLCLGQPGQPVLQVSVTLSAQLPGPFQ